MVKPYNQGDLGGLCGVYSIINVARLLNDLDRSDCEKLFSDIMVYLGDAQLVAEGIGIQAMGRILRDVATPLIPYRALPFRNQKDLDLDSLWYTMFEFMSVDHRAIIIWTGWQGNLDGHWTTVGKVTPARLTLVDSIDFQYINKSQCTMKIPEKHHQYMLYPPCLYLCSSSPIRSDHKAFSKTRV